MNPAKPRAQEDGLLTSKVALWVGGWFAVTAALVGTSGLAGDTISKVLLVAGALVALTLSHGPREQR